MILDIFGQFYQQQQAPQYWKSKDIVLKYYFMYVY